MILASNLTAMNSDRSGGRAYDVLEGRVLLESWDKPVANAPLAMVRAYEGDKTRRLDRDLEMTSVVPPKANRKDKWDYDREPYKLCNEVERLFRRLKGYRRIYTRVDKLDVMFLAFLNFALFVEMIYDLA